MGSYSPSLEELRAEVDAELARFLDDVERGIDRSAALLGEIRALLAAGGKRFRPAFCYWGFRAAGGDHGRPIVRVAASLELLHTFALVHDDIMDESEERRGLKTVHTKLGIGTALLVGDLALVLADDLFMTSGFGADELMVAFAAYSRMRKQVIVGQHAELALGRNEVSVDEAREVARLKSGRYSIKEPLLIGGCLAGDPKEFKGGLGTFGEALGEAFQIRDDVLGTFGSREEVGKPVDADMAEGKKNVLFAITASKLVGEERAFFLGKWGAGDELSSGDADRVRELIETSGALRATEDLVERLHEDSLAALGTLDLAAGPHAALVDLAERVTRRRV